MTSLFALCMTITACAPQGYEAVQNIASQTVQDITCKSVNWETQFWDSLKTYLIEQKKVLNAQDLSEAFRTQLDKAAKDQPSWSAQQVEMISAEFADVVQLLLKEAPVGERVETPEQLLLLLSALDVGDRSTLFRSYMQDKVRLKMSRLKQIVRTLESNCNPSPSQPTENLTSETNPLVEEDYDFHKRQALSQGIPLATFGGRWAFATAYQSCQSLQLPAMNQQSPEVIGISIVGKHPDGVGSKRMISSLPQVQSSHYYIRDMNQYSEGCFNVRQSPLIYDYGGKPFGSTAADSRIDLFKNNGDGTSVLGIDCSAYVYTSMAAAGLRLKLGRPLKASDSWAWGSSSYVEPQDNGLTCLNKITVTPSSSLKAGDVVAVYGHVVIIDSAGADPFGVRSVKSESECSKITSAQFDFVVAQSSPSKGGIGINYFSARDYLPTSSKMKTGLEKYAYYACLAKVNGKSYQPNLGTLSVVRHKGTAECLAPRVKLAREECIQSCSSLQR